MAQRATSLGPKPSLFIIFCFFCFSFPFLAFWCKKKLAFHLEKGIFCLYLRVSPSFSLAFFGLPLFQLSVFFFFLSLSLSLSLVLVLFSSFLSFYFAFFCFLVFVSCFPFLSSLLLFHERNNIKICNCKILLHQSFDIFGFLSCFFFQIPFSYLCYFLISRYVFVQHQCFWFQKNQVEKQQFLVKRGVSTQRVFLSTCVLQNVKSYRFFCHFLGNMWLMLKNTINLGISAHF